MNSKDNSSMKSTLKRNSVIDRLCENGKHEQCISIVQKWGTFIGEEGYDDTYRHLLTDPC